LLSAHKKGATNIKTAERTNTFNKKLKITLCLHPAVVDLFEPNHEND
jgi:hypothetical protein